MLEYSVLSFDGLSRFLYGIDRFLLLSTIMRIGVCSMLEHLQSYSRIMKDGACFLTSFGGNMCKLEGDGWKICLVICFAQ